MSIEAMKQWLEALENSVDLVIADAYNAEQLYGKYPSRQAKVGGLKLLADKHQQAITSLRQAIADADRSVEDWGIDTSAGRPILVYKKCSVIEGDDAYFLLDLIRRANQELNSEKQEPMAEVIRDGSNAEIIRFLPAGLHLQVGTKLYTHPQPKRTPLTHEQRLDLHTAFEPHKSKWNAQSILIDMVESAHGIKENT